MEVWEKVLKDSSVRFTQKLPGPEKTAIDYRQRQKASLNMLKLKTVCDLMFRPMRRRRYTGLCIWVAWLLPYVKRSGLSCWATTSST